jgi:hypothetical protein
LELIVSLDDIKLSKPCGLSYPFQCLINEGERVLILLY